MVQFHPANVDLHIFGHDCQGEHDSFLDLLVSMNVDYHSTLAFHFKVSASTGSTSLYIKTVFAKSAQIHPTYMRFGIA